MTGSKEIYLLSAVSGDEVDMFLLLLHPLHVVGEAGHLAVRVGGEEAEQLGQAGTVRVVLHNSKLDATNNNNKNVVSKKDFWSSAFQFQLPEWAS